MRGPYVKDDGDLTGVTNTNETRGILQVLTASNSDYLESMNYLRSITYVSTTSILNGEAKRRKEPDFEQD